MLSWYAQKFGEKSMQQKTVTVKLFFNFDDELL